MDVDAMLKDFSRFKPMLEEMLPEYEKHKARKAERDAEEAEFEKIKATAEFSGVTDENRDEIYAPLTPAPAVAATVVDTKPTGTDPADAANAAELTDAGANKALAQGNGEPEKVDGTETAKPQEGGSQDAPKPLDGASAAKTDDDGGPKTESGAEANTDETIGGKPDKK